MSNMMTAGAGSNAGHVGMMGQFSIHHRSQPKRRRLFRQRNK
jgi:hypothetical protein